MPQIPGLAQGAPGIRVQHLHFHAGVIGFPSGENPRIPAEPAFGKVPHMLDKSRCPLRLSDRLKEAFGPGQIAFDPAMDT